MSISEKYIAELYNKIQEERPIIHCITNAVTVNDCANILLAAGASPTMAHHPLEVEVREDMHTSDTVQEKLSLYARFGVSIYFGAPNKKEFQNIVKVLAEKYQVSMDEDTLLAEANKWELSHGGLSGRTAQQFINYLLGKE